MKISLAPFSIPIQLARPISKDLIGRIRLVSLGFIALIAAQLTTLFLAERHFLQKYQSISLLEWTIFDWTTASLNLLAGICISLAFMPTKEKLRLAMTRPIILGDFLILSSITLLLATAAYIIWWPDSFYAQISELGPIALLQELVIFFGLVLLGVSAIRATSIKLPRVFSLPGWVLLGLVSLGVCLLLLEETSYGQHYFGWGSPDYFASNAQYETNFHNFYTYQFEVLYYWAALICFMILPIVKLLPIAQRFGNMFYYIPPIEFAVAAIPIGTLMYISWSIVALQFQFFLALSVCCVLYLRSEGAMKFRIGAVLLSMAACLYALIFHGSQLTSGYEPSEMRELAISFCILAYGMWIYSKVKQAGFDAVSASYQLDSVKAIEMLPKRYKS